MNITSTTSVGVTAPLFPLSTTAAPTATSGNSGSAATVGVSSAGGFFSQLQQLQQSDPDKLKQVLTDIGTQLDSAAQNATGPQANALSSMAAKFQNAAQTGDISQLKPSGGHHHHHHHGGGGGGGDASSSSATQDPYAAQQQNSITDFINALASGQSGAAQNSASGQSNPFAQIKSIVNSVIQQDTATTGTV